MYLYIFRIEYYGVKCTGPLVGGSREGKALLIHFHSLKSTALGLREGVANPCDRGKALTFSLFCI